MKFSDVIGHSEKKKAFIQSVSNGRVPHAQLFIGNSGWGTLPLALAYAQYVSCLDRGAEDSCGQCSSCRKYESLTHPDLHFTFPFPREKGEKCSELISNWRKAFLEHPYMNLTDWMQLLDAEKKQANIPTAEIRDILKSLSLKPYESAFKVVVIWLPGIFRQRRKYFIESDRRTCSQYFISVSNGEYGEDFRNNNFQNPTRSYCSY